MRILALIVVAVWTLNGEPQISPGQETAVYEAVAAHAIQPIAARRRPDQPILVRERTVELCDQWPRPASADCVDERFALQHFDGRSAGGRPHVGLDLSSETRTQLIAGFRVANREARRLLTEPSSILKPLSTAEETEMRKGDRGWMLAVASLSAPAFSVDGHALIFGRYSCGTECGYSWIFLLKRDGQRWRVIDEYMISIS